MKYIVDQLLAKQGLSPREVHHGLRIRVLRIGPKEAAALLAANTDNRQLRKGRVKSYQRVMQAGEWQLTHQGIAFSSDGLGLDLQHRLFAVIESGVEVEFMVVEGLDPKAFAAIDQHERRSMSDALRKRRGLVDEARFLLLARGGNLATQARVSEVEEVACLIEQASDRIRLEAPTNRALVTAAPMRAAAIILMHEEPKIAAEVIERYRLMSLQKSEHYAPAMHAFERQVSAKKISTRGHTERMDLFCRGLRVLDPRLADASKLQINAETPKLARQRVMRLIGEPEGYMSLNDDQEEASNPERGATSSKPQTTWASGLGTLR